MSVLARCCFGCSDIIILTCSIASKSPARLRRISRMSKTGSRRASRGGYSVTGIIRTQFCYYCFLNYRQRWHLWQGSAPTKIHHCKQDGWIFNISIFYFIFMVYTNITGTIISNDIISTWCEKEQYSGMLKNNFTLTIFDSIHAGVGIASIQEWWGREKTARNCKLKLNYRIYLICYGLYYCCVDDVWQCTFSAVWSVQVSAIARWVNPLTTIICCDHKINYGITGIVNTEIISFAGTCLRGKSLIFLF